MKKHRLLAVLSTLALAFTVFCCKTDTETEYVDKTYCLAVTFTSQATETGVKVTMATATEGAAIYYTTDGTVPTAETTEYSEPVEFKQDATVKAIAIKNGIENSPVSVATVSIKEKTITVEVEKKLPAGTYTVYHFQQKVTGGVAPESYATVLSETEEEKEIAEGFGLEQIKKDFTGFHAVSFVVNEDSKEKSVYVYYNRNTITYTFKTGAEGKFTYNTTSRKVSGLYGAAVQKPFRMTVVSSNSEKYRFKKWTLVDGSDVPGIFGAEDIKDIIAVWIDSSTITIPEDFVKVTGTTITGTETWTPSSDVFVSGRQLTIPDMYVSDHEVTQAEYAEYCKYGSSSPSSDYGVGDNYPAYYVNWYDAVVFCNLRSIDEGLTPAYKIKGETDPRNWSGIVGDAESKYCGPSARHNIWDALIYDTSANGYRLPTEAEWDYIAKEACTSTTTYSGSDTIDDVAWYRDNSSGKPHEVKGKKPNSLGIYDMSGNVWEWCYDWYGTINSSTADTGPEHSSYRSDRGGTWGLNESYCSVFYRDYFDPNYRGRTLGFRVVRNEK